VYLIDASDSMNEPCGGGTKIGMVNDALRTALRDMVRRSMRDGVLQRRYRVAILAYSSTVIDVSAGIRDLPDLIQIGTPEITASGVTDTAGGLGAVEALLGAHLAEYQQDPAPLVCHLTDAVFTTSDPAPAIRRIQAMRVQDGPVLVEQVYVANGMLRRPVTNWRAWGGVRRESELTGEYARYLFSLSSPLPETYRQTINNYEYRLQQGTTLFFPGEHSDLVRLAFVSSTATQ
jgi:uncharacterized protein YegL